MSKKIIRHKYDGCPKCELKHDHMACAECLHLRLEAVSKVKKI